MILVHYSPVTEQESGSLKAETRRYPTRTAIGDCNTRRIPDVCERRSGTRPFMATSDALSAYGGPRGTCVIEFPQHGERVRAQHRDGDREGNLLDRTTVGSELGERCAEPECDRRSAFHVRCRHVAKRRARRPRCERENHSGTQDRAQEREQDIASRNE